MMKTRLIATGLLLTSSLAIFGCCRCQAEEKAEMMTLGASLVQLSAAVEGYVRYSRDPARTEDGVLTLVSEKNPALLQPFHDYRLRVQVVDRHSSVLVCTKNGKHGLLEDAGCTASMDKHLWEEKPALPCEFTLKLGVTCK